MAPSESERGEVTRLLSKLASDGLDRAEAVNRLFTVVYDELRGLAGHLMQGERPDHTLQPTALVNEAYLRLMGGAGVAWDDRAHFFGIAASAMRQLLVEHARRRAAAKRGGEWERVSLEEALGVAAISDADLLDLDRTLTSLAEKDERMAKVVELRFFAAMKEREIAHVLGVSERTVQDDWRVARMWLARELSEGGGA